MKKIKILFLIICVALSCFCGGCSELTEGKTEKSFFVSCVNKQMEIGDTFEITAVYGESDISFKSTNESVAEVSKEGIVTAKSLGEAVIEIYAEDKKRLCYIEVLDIKYNIFLDKKGPIDAIKEANIQIVPTATKNGKKYDADYDWEIEGISNISRYLDIQKNFATFKCLEEGNYKIIISIKNKVSTEIEIHVKNNIDGFIN